EVEKRSQARYVEALRAYGQKDKQRALALMTEWLDDPREKELEPQSMKLRLFRDQARYIRAQLLLEQGEAGAAAADMSEFRDRKRRHRVAASAALVATLGSRGGHPVFQAAGCVHPTTMEPRQGWISALSTRALAWEKLGEADKANADRLAVT